MAGGSGYAGKPRPVLIVQDDAFAERDSVTVCLISSDPTDLPVFASRWNQRQTTACAPPAA